jgi:segregation and condensation protein B
MDKLTKYIESLIFVSEKSISKDEIKYIIENSFESKVNYSQIFESIESLIKKYDSDEYSFGIVEISNGYTFMTKGAYHNVVGEYLKALTNKRLSKASLETLAIIAYKQPTTKPEIEQIRGVNCDYTIQKLLDKNLIEIEGRDDGPGRALIYSTSKKFMDYFGMKTIKDLPGLKDFEEIDNIVGQFEEE